MNIYIYIYIFYTHAPILQDKILAPWEPPLPAFLGARRAVRKPTTVAAPDNMIGSAWCHLVGSANGSTYTGSMRSAL